ncbi:MAG: hypothetical protein IPO01_19615 [Chitinophagaceae bacterium]|nr:hypothetical protein [Chitinophagaceae bacterium]
MKKKYHYLKQPLFLLVMVVSTSVIQCKKEGDIIKGLDRSFSGTADSTIYAVFYESNTITPSDAVPDVNDNQIQGCTNYFT